MYEIKTRRLHSQILTCFIFLVLFKKKPWSYWIKLPFKKKCYSWGRTRLYWYRWHWKLKRIHLGLCLSMRNMGISWLLILLENLLQILTKRRSRCFAIATPGSENRCPLSEKCYRRAYFFSNYVEYLLWISQVSMIFLVIFFTNE